MSTPRLIFRDFDEMSRESQFRLLLHVLAVVPAVARLDAPTRDSAAESELHVTVQPCA